MLALVFAVLVVGPFLAPDEARAKSFTLPGASAELGSSGAPGTYGTANLGDAYRIVWHYRATDEQRTFTVRYRLSGLAVAYDDVVDVYWQVWGDEWQEPPGSP